MRFTAVVLLISSIVILYRERYIENDKIKIYFCYRVLLFVFSILLLIISPNIIIIILGWDGLGLVSYCLVIYYQRVNSYNSGIITILRNRVGDVTLLIRIIFLINCGALDIDNLQEIIKICGIFILISGLTKRAQIPFSAWLPAAIAAPTPVSSLVHSSTLVTAGIYLLIRFSFLFNIELYSKLLIILSIITLFIAGVGANLEIDFKKIIAFSTLRQLGLIILILSLGKPELAFFHLIIHALFKSILFLCAGLVIHNMGGVQDIRYLGRFFCYSPLIRGCIGLARLSLFGFPFVGGFYSKDLILEYIYMNINNFLLISLLIVRTSLTILYCIRIIYYVIWKGIISQRFFSKHVRILIIFPIYCLRITVIFLGSVFSWIILTNEIFLVLSNFRKILNLLLIIITFYIFFILYIKEIKGFFIKSIYIFFRSMWFISLLTRLIFLKNIKKINLSENDWKWVEEMGPGGLTILIKKNSLLVIWIRNNYLRSMIIIFLRFIFFILIFYSYSL